MQTETGKIAHDLELRGALNLSGMCTGIITVMKGGHLILTGMANGVIVEEGGIAIIHGMCTGSVINRGGTIEVYGTAKKVDTMSGKTHIDPNADIQEMVYDANSGIPRWFTIPNASEYQWIRSMLDTGYDDDEVIKNILKFFKAEDDDEAQKTAALLVKVAKGTLSITSLLKELEKK